MPDKISKKRHEFLTTLLYLVNNREMKYDEKKGIILSIGAIISRDEEIKR